MIVQTPGVYIKEKSVLPNSVAGVSTAVPAFIGFTEIVPREQSTNARLVKRITSMFEFENMFGGAYKSSFNVDLGNDSLLADKRFFLYDSLYLYFRNGGGPCYIISAGDYQSASAPSAANTALEDQIIELDHLDEATIAVMPDVHIQFNVSGNQEGLSLSEYGTICSALITKCAALKDKFAIIDYHNPQATALEIRNSIVPSSTDIKYGAVYYPWLINATSYSVSADQLTLAGATSSTLKDTLADVNADVNSLIGAYGAVYSLSDLQSEYRLRSTNVATKTGFTNLFNFLNELFSFLDSRTTLTDGVIDNYRTALSQNTAFANHIKQFVWMTATIENAGLFLASPNIASPNDQWIQDTYSSTYSTYADLKGDYSVLGYTSPSSGSNSEKNAQVIQDLNSGQYVDLTIIFSGIAGLFDAALSRKQMIEEQLFSTDTDYMKANKMVQDYMKLIPAQGAISGIYCKNDRDRGVWKSPANIAVQGIEKPLVEVSNADQDRLNVDSDTGKSINVIRTFTGKGPLVWGARTLAGNSNEWRYISVRRFFSYAEESILKAMNPFVYEPNNARTWVKIKAMVTSFLVEQWKAGALVGASLDEAFFVRVGKDTTSETEILEGKINIQIGMAVARPAEFIILEFSHFTKA